jgi:hypothetical protein
MQAILVKIGKNVPHFCRPKHSILAYFCLAVVLNIGERMKR